MERIKKRVVLLDDDTDFLRAIGAVLEDGGYEVLTCEKPAESVSLIQKFQPDCLLLDLNMPVWDGKVFLRWIRRQLPDLAVVLCTGITGLDPIYFSRLGVHSIIYKPFSAEDLYEMVDRAIIEKSSAKPKTKSKPKHPKRFAA